MSRVLRDTVVTWAALVLWPVTGVVALVVLVRRVLRHEGLMSGRDLSWIGRRVALVLGSLVVYVIAASIASIWISFPDI